MIHKATEGTRVIDSRYRTRRLAAKKEGLLWGAYHFGTKANGVKQANHFLKKIGNTSTTLLVLNVESYKSKIMTNKQIKDFIKTVRKKTKSFVMIYGSYNTLRKYSLSIIAQNPLWIAFYDMTFKVPSGWGKWVIWQYTNGVNGSLPHVVNGIGPCDRDVFNGSVDELKKFWPNVKLHH